jgi:malate dehydrogenase
VILGAGELGGAVARQLAVSDTAGRIVLVDDSGSVAAGKALDILQASPVEASSAAISGTTDVSAVVGASLIVVADRHGPSSEEWQEEAGLALIRRVASLNETAPILCAGACQASLIERGVADLGLPRRRLFGSAPEALRSAVTAVTALEAGCAPRDIMLMVLGRPPQLTIVPWEEASIAGSSATSVLTPPALSRLDQRLPRLWPPGPMTLAGAATRVARAALTRSPQTVAVFVALLQGEGHAGRAAALPVQLDPAGIARLVAPSVSARDRVRLEVALGA